MCIFSQSVLDVSATKVFARLAGDHQHLAYEMHLSSESELAMILPLPTQAATEDQVAFVDLSEYEDFFDEMEECFPKPRSASFDLGGRGPAPLVVHQVGAFDASFVPALSDFGRLDARFRLPDNVWEHLPLYRDFGFAVFQLRAGDSRIHPMALSFRTRHPAALFFPTAHVHDGTVHPTAEFDHLLYAQGGDPSSGWEEGFHLPQEMMNFGDSDRTKGLVDPHTLVVRCRMRGLLPNQDTWLPAANGAPV